MGANLCNVPKDTKMSVIYDGNSRLVWPSMRLASFQFGMLHIGFKAMCVDVSLSVGKAGFHLGSRFWRPCP